MCMLVVKRAGTAESIELKLSGYVEGMLKNDWRATETVYFLLSLGATPLSTDEKLEIVILFELVKGFNSTLPWIPYPTTTP